MSSAAIVSKVTAIVSKHHKKHVSEGANSIVTKEPSSKDDDGDMSTASDSPAPDDSIGNESYQQENKKSSLHTGVTYYKRDNKWRSYIRHGKKRTFLGYYKLETDAALAVDEAVRLLSGPDAEMNFATSTDYENAKKHELDNSGFGNGVAMSSAAIVSKVTAIVSKHKARDVGEGAKSMATKEPSSNNSEKAKSTTTKEPSSNHNSEKASSFYSNFIGVSFNNNKYLARIRFKSKLHCIGYWRLETDAAMAFDEAAKLLRGADFSKVNFSSRQDYLAARAKELEKIELSSRVSVDNLSTIAMMIQKQLSKFPCPEINVINDLMAKKWARYLPAETGNEFLDSYQGSVDEIFGLPKLRRSETDPLDPSIVSNSVGHKLDGTRAPVVEMESVNPVAFFKPITENSPNNTSPQHHSEPEGDSNNDASLFSNAEETDALLSPNPTVIVQALDVSDAISLDHNNDIITPASNQRKETDQIKEFPLGCRVLWNFDGNSFRSGMVSSASIDGMSYNVTPTKRSGETKSSVLIPEKELAFGPNCPVYVSSTRGQEAHLLKGKILTTFTSVNNLQAGSFIHTILINKEGNQFQVMKDVPSECVKYRKVIETELPTPTNKNSSSDQDMRDDDDIQDEGPRAHQSQANKTSTSRRAPANSTSYHTAAEENYSQTSSRHFFSSNSTITTVDLAPASSRRVNVDGTSISASSSSVKCRVYFPRWLVHDSASKQRLQSHLLQVDRRSNKYQCLQRIGRKTNCTLRIVEEVHLHVLIETKASKYATDDIRKASNELEHALLVFLNGDGSSGRLFYDLAKSSKFLHPSAGTSSVMQRNPFTPNNEMGWMNIIELPYIRDGGNRKHYHGHYLIAKKGNILGQIAHTRCFLKICGNNFRVPTELCAPYIFVMGDQPGQVDTAVGILREAIQNHTRECKCSF